MQASPVTASCHARKILTALDTRDSDELAIQLGAVTGRQCSDAGEEERRELLAEIARELSYSSEPFSGAMNRTCRGLLTHLAKGPAVVPLEFKFSAAGFQSAPSATLLQ